jgi:hypothetical protein
MAHNHETDVEISTVNILENYIPKEGSIFRKTYDYPHATLLHELIAIYRNCNIVCTISAGGEECDLLPQNGVPELINLEVVASTFDVTIDFLEVEENAIISNMMVDLLSLKAVPVKMNDVKIIKNPEQGISIAFDFTDALDVASGEDECASKEVQIRMPNGSVVTIDKSSLNFYWRQDILYCNVPCGYEHTVRIRYTADKLQIDWSDWLKFTPRRKMTL